MKTSKQVAIYDSTTSSEIAKVELSSRKLNEPIDQRLHKRLLVCGILSSILYAVANIITVMLYEGYNAASQTVSELSAIDAPTRTLWVLLMIPYSLLMIGFGTGVWQSAAGNRSLRITGALFIADAVIGFFWPPMHQREVLAAGGGTLTDTLHIVFTMITVPLMILPIVFGAVASGKRFRVYSIATLAILVAAGILTGIDGPKIAADLPTPGIGIWERINIGVYMLWVAVFAIMLLRKEKRAVSLTST
jgi:hypothetical protein